MSTRDVPWWSVAPFALLCAALLFVSCSAVGGWLGEPVGEPTVSDGTVTYPVDVNGDGEPDSWVTAPEPPTGPITVDVPTGEGQPPVSVTIQPGDWRALRDEAGRPTRGGAIVSAIGGIAGGVNPLLGFGVMALGNAVLGVVGSRRRASQPTATLV